MSNKRRKVERRRVPDVTRMRAKQHFGVRRSPVSGKVCFKVVTRPFRGKDKKFRPKRAEEKLLKSLLAYAKPLRAQREHYELVTGRKAPKPLTKKEREAWAKKALAEIKGRGLGETEMFILSDLVEEYLPMMEAERRKLLRKNWRKALATIKQKARLREQREKERQREDRRRQQERIRRAWENLEKPPAAVTRWPYI